MRIIGYTVYKDGKLEYARADVNILIRNGEYNHLKDDLTTQFLFFDSSANVDIHCIITENDSEKSYTALQLLAEK